MVRELEAMGVKLMVSVWLTVSPVSENYATMRERGLLVNTEYGVDTLQIFLDNEINGPAYLAYYDATNPEARQFMWDTIKRNYFAQGVRLWWLDSDEPDANPWRPENLRFHLGSGLINVQHLPPPPPNGILRGDACGGRKRNSNAFTFRLGGEPTLQHGDLVR